MLFSTELSTRRLKLAGILPRLQSANSFLPFENDTLPLADSYVQTPKILIVRSSPYRDVEQSLSHLVIYDCVRRFLPDALIDFALMPSREDRNLFESAGFSWPLGIRSLLPLAGFDLVLVNISYVLESLNIPLLIHASCLSRFSADRQKSDPIMVLGGSATLHARALLSKTPDGNWLSPFEAWFFGDFEPAVESIIGALFGNKPNVRQSQREDQLNALKKDAANIPGLWIPAIDNPVAKSVCDPRVDSKECISYPVLNNHEANTVRIQISHGCPFACSFCFEGFGRKPYRDINAEYILEKARRFRQSTGADSVDLVSFNFNTHKQIQFLLCGLQEIFPHVHFMSQRLDILQQHSHLLESELIAQKRSFTLGIEGISNRMRSYYEKNLNYSDIRQLCRRLIMQRVKEIKFFFIVSGLENGQDLQEFADFVNSLALDIQNYGFCRLVFSMGILLRMPFTPMQFGNIGLTEEKYQVILQNCQNSVEACNFEFRKAFSFSEFLISQILVMGNQLSENLFKQLCELGIDYQGVLAHSALAICQSFLKNNAEEMPAFCGEKGPQFQHPMDFVQGNITGKSLYDRFLLCQKALNDPEKIEFATKESKFATHDADYRKQIASALGKWQKTAQLYAIVRLPAGLAGAGPQWLNAWLNRQCLVQFPKDYGFRQAREILFSQQTTGFQHPWFGYSLISIALDQPQELLAKWAKPNQQQQRSGNDLEIIEIFSGKIEPWENIEFIFGLGTNEANLAIKNCQTFLAANHVGATLIKKTDSMDFSVAKKHQSKKQIAALSLITANPEIRCRITLLPRFNFANLIGGMYPKHARQFTTIECTGFSMGGITYPNIVAKLPGKF